MTYKNHPRIAFKTAWTLIFALLSTALHAQDIPSYEALEIQEYPEGTSGFAFGYGFAGPTGDGPLALSFYTDGTAIFSDWSNERFVVTRNFETVSNVIAYDTDITLLARQVIPYENDRIDAYWTHQREQLVSINNEGEVIAYVRWPHDRIHTSFYISNTYFAWDDDGLIYSIVNPGPNHEHNNRRILNTDETVRLFQEGSEYETDGLTIDRNYRLFQDGQLVTRSYRQFIEHWRTIYGERYTRIDDHEAIVLGPSQNMQFMGTDQDGNTYWSSSRLITVFDESGIALDTFEFDRRISNITPAVHPSGDVYLFEWDIEYTRGDSNEIGSIVSGASFHLHRIERRW